MHKKRKLPGFTSAPVSPQKRCAMKMKVEKKRWAPKLFFDGIEEGVYKARAENWCHGYQTTSGH